MRRLDWESFRTRILVTSGLFLGGLGLLWAYNSFSLEQRGRSSEASAQAVATATSIAMSIDGDLHRRVVDGVPRGKRFESWTLAPQQVVDLRSSLTRSAEMQDREHLDVRTLRLLGDAVDKVTDKPDRRHLRAVEVIVSTGETPMWRKIVDYEPDMAPAFFHNESSAYRSAGGNVVGTAPLQDSFQTTVGIVFVEEPMRGSLAILLFKLIVRLGIAGGVVVAATRALDLTIARLLNPLSESVEALMAMSRGEQPKALENPSTRELRNLVYAVEGVRARFESGGGVRANQPPKPLGFEAMANDLVNQVAAGQPLGRVQSGRHLRVSAEVALEGGTRMQKALFDLDSVLKGVTREARALAAQRGVRFQLTQPQALPGGLHGDGELLRVVLEHIMKQALLITESGTVQLHVALGPQSRTSQLRFEIGATSRALSNEERLTLLRRAGTEVTPGATHLAELVERLGGRLGFESEPVSGTRFWFTARFELAAASGRSAPSRQSVAPDADWQAQTMPAGPTGVPHVAPALTSMPNGGTGPVGGIEYPPIKTNGIAKSTASAISPDGAAIHEKPKDANEQLPTVSSRLFLNDEAPPGGLHLGG